MTTKEEYLALAERCEREEPGADLDSAIWKALFPAEPSANWEDYTSSLDAAVTLVPNGNGYIAGKKSIDTADGVVFGSERTVRVTASTPALALCAAALRARAALVKP